MDLDPFPAILPADLIPALLCALPSGFSAAQAIALTVALLCLIISGFVSGSEIAFFSLTSAQCDELDDTPCGPSVRSLLARPERLLATILIANNLVNVTIVILCNFALGPVFDNMPEILSFVLQTVILTFLILLFGEILPKIYANNYPVRWARSAVGGITFFEKLFSPLSGLLVRSSSIVKRVVSKRTDSVTTDELSTALDITDVKAGGDKDILQGIIHFGDTSASEIMTPRIDITDLDISLSFGEVMKVVVESGYSRLPVCDGSQDNICGVLYSRDLLPYVGRTAEDFQWQKLLREPYFVPESRMIDDIFEDFRKLKIHMAIVVDEFGGTQGIVTMEDVLEEIVGDINDEYDDQESTYKRLRDNTFVFEGRTLLTDFFRITGLNADDYAEVTDDAETLAGMILAIKGDFPRDKEPLVYGRCRFLVLDVTDHRITSVRVMVMPESEEQ